MARVTVEDCISKVVNRFELVLLATQRARELTSGAMPTVPRDNDKNHVIALREIAEETIRVEDLRDRFLTLLEQQLCGSISQDTHESDLSHVMDQERTSYLKSEEIEKNDFFLDEEEDTEEDFEAELEEEMEEIDSVYNEDIDNME